MMKILTQHLRGRVEVVLIAISVILSILGLAKPALPTAPTFSLLHSFTGAPGDGSNPWGGLIQGTDGNFYGTTGSGGTYGRGTAYKMDPTGSVTILHSFTGYPSDASFPTASLVQAADGTFYGTSPWGGAYDGGTVFKMDGNGNVSVLHSFSGCACRGGYDDNNGSAPQAGLVLANDGSLYGTTLFSGTYGGGIVFRIDGTGNFTLVYSFNPSVDGAQPYGTLIQARDGKFYGTNAIGGAYGEGTVFRIDANGNFTVLYSFPPGYANPIAGLLEGRDGNFYFVDQYRTVYKMDGNGNVSVFYYFWYFAPYPAAALIQASDGNFYGTAQQGAFPPYNNNGIVFKLDSSGAITVLHSFDGIDGAWPRASLLQARDGNLYGVTYGTVYSADNQGTVFKMDLGLAITPVVAHAGPNQSVNEGAAVTLDGTGSTGQNLAYNWQQLAGPPAQLSNSTSPNPSFTAPQLSGGFGSQVMTFQLTVSSGSQSATDTVNITVVNINHAPEAHVGADQNVAEGSPVTLDGRASFDPDSDPITYQWAQLSGPTVVLTGANTAQASFTAPLIPGGVSGPITLTFSLSVSDGALSSTTQTTVAVDNVDHAPIADPGDPQTVHSGTVVALDGSGSSDPDGDPITYQWVQVIGPAVQLNNAATASPSFTAPPVSGTTALTFRLIVTDSLLPSSPEDVVVTVKNGPPLCNLARAVPDVLWPPNHTMVPVGITGVTDPDDNTVAITIGYVTQDEPVNGLGDGDTSPDASNQGGNLLLRAERSGKGNGRVYKIGFTANDGEGGTCIGSVKVAVPQNLKPGMEAVDDGQLYNSTQP